MTDDQIKQIVSRFLTWLLPEDFNPDGGISFKQMFNEHTAHPMKAEPTGTNLLNFQQTEAMVRHILADLDCAASDRSIREELSDQIATLRAQLAEALEWKRYWSGEMDVVLAGRADETDRADRAEAALTALIEKNKSND